MPPSTPTVSVIVPVYRGVEWIGRTLDSLLAQKFADFEVLCVDDHSPDGSAAIIKAQLEADPRIRYLQTPVNQGIVPRVINCVRNEVRGRYFAYASQDDLFSPDWLQKMVAAMDDSGADAVVPNLEFVTREGDTIRRLSGAERFGKKTISGTDAFSLSLDWTIPGNALWKSEFLREYGYFDFGLYADEYTARYYFLKCRSVAFCDGTFYYAQGNPEAITRRVSAGRLDYPYNQFKVWELAHQHAPEKAPRFARSVVRDLFEALVMAASHSQLSHARDRIKPAIEGMRTAEFRSDLNCAFSTREKARKAAALALLDSAGARALLPWLAISARWLKSRIQPMAQDDVASGPINSSR